MWLVWAGVFYAQLRRIVGLRGNPYFHHHVCPRSCVGAERTCSHANARATTGIGSVTVVGAGGSSGGGSACKYEVIDEAAGVHGQSGAGGGCGGDEDDSCNGDLPREKGGGSSSSGSKGHLGQRRGRRVVLFVLRALVAPWSTFTV